MEPEKQFQLIRDFLSAHQFLWESEVLNRYGHSLPSQYLEWANSLEKFDYQMLANLESYSTDSISNDGLRDFIQECHRLSEIPKIKVSPEKIPSNLHRNINTKKQHEIEYILGLVKNSKAQSIVDIGSGMGLLSSVLAWKNQKRKVLCIDHDKALQSRGQSRLEKWAPEIKNNIEFRPKWFDAKTTLSKCSEQNMLIGLHSCGRLSVDLMRLFLNNEFDELVSFGCCYHKLDDQYNLSQKAKEIPLHFTNHALTLAAKCNSTQSQDTYRNKIRVKRFRYGLYFVCYDQLGIQIQSIGNTQKGDELLSFSDYLKKYLEEEIIKKLNLSDAQNYIQSEVFEKTFGLFLRLGAIRALTGRLIEVYLNLDRMFWLQEHGHQVQLTQVFDGELSPRNIGIFKLK